MAVQEARKALNQENDEKLAKIGRRKVKQDWSLTHGFYAGMGGFVFDFRTLSSAELESCIPDRQRLTLTARGVALLARCGLLPQLSQEEIDDKNKADHLAKTVVCFQATWFLIQTIARLRAKLAVSLLEVMTIAHVACALFVYLLWWKKPAMVQQPIYLVGNWVPAVCTFMYMSSQISVYDHDRPGVSRRAWLDSELSALVLVDVTEPVPRDIEDSSNEHSVVNSNTASADNHDSTVPTISSQATLKPRALVSQPFNNSAKAAAFVKSYAKVSSPSETDLGRWKLCEQALRGHSELRRRLIEQSVTGHNEGSDCRKVYTFRTEELVTEASSNWPSEHLLRGTRGLVMGIILWSASICFGAIHLSAWNEHFPTTAEAWLWRSSALFVAGSGALWMLINVLAQTIPWVDQFWDSVVALKVNRLAGAALMISCGICGLLYVVARLFLVLESFISLRALPASTYQTPDWTQLIPHF